MMVGASRWLVIVWLVACKSSEPPIPSLHVGPVADRASPLAITKLADGDYHRAIGTAHPATLVVSAQNGRWLVACQARKDTDGKDGISVSVDQHGRLSGDKMTGYLFRGGGDGAPIDDFVAASHDDRWLVVLRAGKLVLIDDVNATESTISDADTRADQQGAARAAAFDAAGTRLVYFRQAGNASRVVIRDLAKQREREIALPDVLVWRAAVESGDWMSLLFIREDTNHNGRLDWPTVQTNAPLGQLCAGEAASYSTFGSEGDEVQRAWLRLDTGEVIQDATMLAHVGAETLARSADKSIRLGSRELIPAACEADVLAVSEHPPRVLATCAGTSSRAPVEMFGPGVHVVVDPEGVPRGKPHGVKLLDTPYVCRNPESCLGIEDGKPVKLSGSVQTISHHQLLLSNHDTFSVLDASTGIAKPLAGVSGYIRARADNIVAIDTSIVDLAKGSVVGEVPREPLAVDRDGRALVPALSGASSTGPLTWLVPTPAHASAAGAMPTDGVWSIEGVAVDEANHPMKNVTVTVSEAQFKTNNDGTSSPMEPWHPAGFKDDTMTWSQHALKTRTDDAGRFSWTPVLPGSQAVMLVADDGRVGSADRVRPGETGLTIQLRPAGSIHVVCKDPETMGPVNIAIGKRRLTAPCGATLGGLAPGRYQLAAKRRKFKYEGRDVDVRSGATTEALLEVAPAGTIEGRVVEFPGDKPVAGAECDARWKHADRDIDGDPGTISKPDGTFELQISRGPIAVWCEGPKNEFAPGVADTTLGARASVTVRVVRHRRDGVDTGAEIEAESDGARIIKVAKLAERSGLRRGDLVRAVDDIPLAGLSRRSMLALAFVVPPDAKPRWSVIRDGRAIVIAADR